MIQTYFLIFVFYAILGWVFETIYATIKEGKFVNRGFLIGPWLPIYGYGALLVTLLLKKYLDDPVALFFMAMIICSVLEYMTSYFLEKIFKARWWDYSHLKFNINGRICLETMIPFGVLSLLVMYVINPLVESVVADIPSIFITIISIILFVLFIIDNIISFKLTNDLKKKVFTAKEDNTEEINNIFKEKIKNHKEKLSILNRRIINAFPKKKHNKK